MLKQYKYKIQWLLKPKESYKIIRALGVKSFDVINLRDRDLKIVDSYTGFIMFPYGLAEVETIKYIKKYLKKYMFVNNYINDEVLFVEVIRK